MKRLLKIRKNLQQKRKFNSRVGHWTKCVDAPWREPRGIHSKMRQNIRSKGRQPSPGYQSPIAIRGAMPDGTKATLIYGHKDMAKLPKGSAVLLSSTIGKKGREKVLAKAQELSIRVIN